MKPEFHPDPQRSEPLYLQVLNYLKERIADGTYSANTAMPSELELIEMLQVSRPTVRHAMQILIEEGLVERAPGRGTFIVEKTSAIKQRPRTGNLAIIVPEVRDSFLMKIIRGAEYIASQRGYHLLLCNAGNQIGLEQKCLSEVWDGGKVDGILLMPADAHQPHQMLQRMIAEGVPMVFIDRYFPETNVPFVTSKNIEGGYLLTHHLLERGYRKIGFVTRPNLYVTSVAERLQGYKQALQEAGISYDPSLIFQNMLPFLSAIQVLGKTAPELADYDRAAMKEFLTYSGRPEAVVSCNDVIAAQLYEVCAELNLRIPDDIAIVGFDDDTIAPLLNPPLTTIHQQSQEMGARATSILIDILTGKRAGIGSSVKSLSEELFVFLPVEMKIRKSSGSVEGGKPLPGTGGQLSSTPQMTSTNQVSEKTPHGS